MSAMEQDSPQPPGESYALHPVRCTAVARKAGVLACLVLAVQAGLLGYSAFVHSPTFDEPAHLAAGLTYWRTGSFALYRVNPPLARLVASAPVVFRARQTSEQPVPREQSTARLEWNSGRRLLRAHGDSGHALLFRARVACLTFSLVGGFVCYGWARDLYGPTAGVVSVCLWSFCPNVLAWGSTIGTDVPAAAMGVLACYGFWRWLCLGGTYSAFRCGIGLGLALLTKFTWIVLVVVWPAVWLVCRRRGQSTRAVRAAGQLCLVLLVGLCVLNVGYGYEGSFRRLGEYDFVSRALSGTSVPGQVLPPGANRFCGTWLASIPVPLPVHCLRGMDEQLRDFELGKWSYMRGEWRFGGWWYYYLYAAAIKVPLGTWLLLLVAVAMSAAAVWRRWGRRANREEVQVGAGKRDGEGERSRRDVLAPAVIDIDGLPGTRHGPLHSWSGTVALLAPALCVFIVVSPQTGFSRYFRYVLPCFPFLFIFISRVALAFERPSPAIDHAACAAARTGDSWLKALVISALVWSVGSSLSIYPHSLSYFNEMVGGPTGGHWHMIDANIDWGQDLQYLNRWCHDHPEAQPLRAALYAPFVDGYVAPFGRGLLQPARETALRLVPYDLTAREGPRPGWYAMSVHRLHDRDGKYLYFLTHCEPTAMAGYSIHIYYLSLQQANRIRRDLRMALLPGRSVPPDRGQLRR